MKELSEEELVKFRAQKSDEEIIHEIPLGTVLRVNGVEMKVMASSKNGTIRLRPMQPLAMLVKAIPMVIDKVDHGDFILKMAKRKF